MQTRVIVVDDNIDTLDIFCEYLELKDCQVVGKGYNGLDAVKLYEEHHPDIALLDVMMPDYDGMYALEKIKELDPNAKVIMVTADLTDKTAKRCNELGASEIIYKPYEIEDVVEVVQNVMSGKKFVSSFVK
ncbi:MAG: response regulator [Crenarchaeota archaeon]|nr:MAG: response regulator [Thermoproteota archaeon]RDJ32956.1 MAG: response regulator [Thermoproteota archaeon]RDJ35840.1 MAG: response regulator [Thermoproteota archaeon]RDJ38208.1 MAG: response regulator [Thermoproteota archaeon]